MNSKGLFCIEQILRGREDGGDERKLFNQNFANLPPSLGNNRLLFSKAKEQKEDLVSSISPRRQQIVRQLLRETQV